MKNKNMVKEIQRLLPESYECRQCGVAKLFCAYAKSSQESEWRDPGIVGVAAVITQNKTYSTYIRVYEFDNVMLDERTDL